MKSANVNLVRLLSVFSFASILFLTVSAQIDKRNPTRTRKTNSTDGILLLFFFLRAVSVGGDPCLPVRYSWVKCSSDDTPRVTEINLAGKSSGSFLPDFSAMDALEKIDLSNSLLYGMEFPDFLANFPNLKVLNLERVPWRGTVPTSLKKRSDNGTLKLTLSPKLTKMCYSDKDVCPPGTEIEAGIGTDGETFTTSFDGMPSRKRKSRKKKSVPILVGIIIFVIFWGVVGVFITNRRKRKASAAAGQMNETTGLGVPSNTNTMSPSPLLPGVNYQDPRIATRNIMPEDHLGVKVDQKMRLAVPA
ncbi:hypothetical protein MKW92_048921 [Papaver armeniacum]|nr:hypothetical protein MKW92_048921 [Papaver armeniacum]